MGERNWLATEIDGILRASSGPVTVREIVASISNKEGEHPSSGAVAAALKRWAEQGYITTTAKPLGFKSFVGKQQERQPDHVPGEEPGVAADRPPRGPDPGRGLINAEEVRCAVPSGAAHRAPRPAILLDLRPGGTHASGE